MTFVTLTILQLNIFVLDLFSISSKLIEWWVIAPTRLLLLWEGDRLGREGGKHARSADSGSCCFGEGRKEFKRD